MTTTYDRIIGQIVDITVNDSSILSTTISYRRDTNLCSSIGTLEVVLVDDGTRFDPWDVVLLYENNGLKGTYYIANCDVSAKDGTYTIYCQDDSKRLIDYFIDESYDIGEDIAYTSTWISTFMSLAGVGYNIKGGQGVPLSKNTTLGLCSAYDAITQLLQYSGWYMYFDEGGTAQIGPHSLGERVAEDVPIYQVLTSKLVKHDSMLRNRVVVWGNSDPETGDWIIADVRKPTQWDYDSGDLRTVVYSNTDIYNQATAEEISRKILKEFAKITYEKYFSLAGLFDFFIADTIKMHCHDWTGKGLITSISVSVNSTGAITDIVLDERCPRLFAYWDNILPEYTYVYIGTDTSGVWRKPIGEDAWEDYSQGLPSGEYSGYRNIYDLYINQDNFVTVNTSGEAYYRYDDGDTDTEWGLLYPTNVQSSGGTVPTSSLEAKACAINHLNNDILVAYNHIDDYGGGWVVTFSGYVEAPSYQAYITSGEVQNYDLSIIDIDTADAYNMVTVEALASGSNIFVPQNLFAVDCRIASEIAKDYGNIVIGFTRTGMETPLGDEYYESVINYAGPYNLWGEDDTVFYLAYNTSTGTKYFEVTQITQSGINILGYAYLPDPLTNEWVGNLTTNPIINTAEDVYKTVAFVPNAFGISGLYKIYGVTFNTSSETTTASTIGYSYLDSYTDGRQIYEMGGAGGYEYGPIKWSDGIMCGFSRWADGTAIYSSYVRISIWDFSMDTNTEELTTDGSFETGGPSDFFPMLVGYYKGTFGFMTMYRDGINAPSQWFMLSTHIVYEDGSSEIKKEVMIAEVCTGLGPWYPHVDHPPVIMPIGEDLGYSQGYYIAKLGFTTKYLVEPGETLIYDHYRVYLITLPVYTFTPQYARSDFAHIEPDYPKLLEFVPTDYDYFTDIEYWVGAGHCIAATVTPQSVEVEGDGTINFNSYTSMKLIRFGITTPIEPVTTNISEPDGYYPISIHPVGDYYDGFMYFAALSDENLTYGITSASVIGWKEGNWDKRIEVGTPTGAPQYAGKFRMFVGGFQYNNQLYVYDYDQRSRQEITPGSGVYYILKQENEVFTTVAGIDYPYVIDISSQVPSEYFLVGDRSSELSTTVMLHSELNDAGSFVEVDAGSLTFDVRTASFISASGITISGNGQYVLVGSENALMATPATTPGTFQNYYRITGDVNRLETNNNTANPYIFMGALQSGVQTFLEKSSDSEIFYDYSTTLPSGIITTIRVDDEL